MVLHGIGQCGLGRLAEACRKFCPFRHMALQGLQLRQGLVLAVHHPVVELGEGLLVHIISEAILPLDHGGGFAGFQGHGVNTKAGIEAVKLGGEKPQDMAGVMGGSRKPCRKLGPAAIAAEEFEDQPQSSLSLGFKVVAKVLREGAEDRLQAFMGDDGFHQGAVGHEGGGRVDGIQGFMAVALQFIQAQQHIFIDGFAAKPSGQTGAGQG